MRMIIMGILSMALMAVVLISAFHARYQEVIAENLRAYASSLSGTATPAALSAVNTGDYRVTLIAENGTVLFLSLIHI